MFAIFYNIQDIVILLFIIILFFIKFFRFLLPEDCTLYLRVTFNIAFIKKKQDNNLQPWPNFLWAYKKEIKKTLGNTAFYIIFRIGLLKSALHSNLLFFSIYLLVIFRITLTLNLLYILEIMDLLTFATICLILAYCKIHTFLILTFNFSLFIIALVNRTVLSIANISPWAVFYIFLICVNESLILSLSSMLYLRWLCKLLRFDRKTHTSS